VIDKFKEIDAVFTQPINRSIRKFATLVLAPAALAATVPACTVPSVAQTYSVVSDFLGIPNGPQYLKNTGQIPQGRDGNLYGTSHEGGTAGIGTFFSVSPAGTELTPYSFSGPSGEYPVFGLTLGSDGNFYGSTSLGGSSNLGVVYKITSAGVTTVLHNFTNTGDGEEPNTPPVEGKDGNYYGVTNLLPGTVFYKVTSAGVYTVLHTMTSTDGYDGGGLTLGSDGNFYGASYYGGTNNEGTIFKVSTKGVYKVLYNFDGTDGYHAFAPPVQGTDGKFYGMTSGGGPTNDGVIYRFTSSGAYTVLHFLTAATDGGTPQAGLMQATDGNFYGAASLGGSLGGGTLFKITPAGAFTVVYPFSGTDDTNGADPESTLTQNTNGLLYGDTYNSPGNSYGIFYSLNIGAKPFARLASTSGLVASSVSIFGQGFSSSSVVKFDGVTANGVVLQGTTYITVPVPAGALTGSVTVTTGSTTLTSNAIFKVLPKVKSFSPTSGPVGTSVVITGVSLTQASAVKFDGIAATTFTVNSDTQITAVVPTGAKTGKIAVTTKGGASISSTTFTVE
jgi:uncharacterized repeat protein (TIGR03803 family)